MSNGKRLSSRGGHGMQGVFVFVLLGLFAIMSTLLVLLGAQMYRGTVEHTARNNNDRIMSAYVRSMVRAGDMEKGVVLEDYDGVKTIALRETLDDEEYVTWLYLYEGELFELFTDAETEFDPEMGDAICAAQAFEPELSDGLLTVRMQDEQGRPCEVRLALHAS